MNITILICKFHDRPPQTIPFKMSGCGLHKIKGCHNCIILNLGYAINTNTYIFVIWKTLCFFLHSNFKLNIDSYLNISNSFVKNAHCQGDVYYSHTCYLHYVKGIKNHTFYQMYSQHIMCNIIYCSIMTESLLWLKVMHIILIILPLMQL